MDDQLDLTGKLLIAMPGMGDPRFEHAVVYLCAHSDEGAMGIIVNKPLPDLAMSDLLKQLKIAPNRHFREGEVHFGGPVEHGRGFVLHDAGYASDVGSMQVEGGFSLTATLDILEDLARGAGPERRILALGYAGWGPGQLEGELAQNAWLTVDASPELVFDADDIDKWDAALERLGVSAVMLSSDAGRA